MVVSGKLASRALYSRLKRSVVPNSGRVRDRTGCGRAGIRLASVRAPEHCKVRRAGAASEIMHDVPPAYLVYEDSGASSCFKIMK